MRRTTYRYSCLLTQTKIRRCHLIRNNARFFLNVPYDLREGQELLVDIPPRCPHWKSGCDECDVKGNGWRPRKTGPCHPLRRVKCRHGAGYTLYPPGHYPHGRSLVAPVSPDGELVRLVVAGEEVDEEVVGKLAWSRTICAAALDAALGLSWNRESPGDDHRRRRTQRRYLTLTAALLGLTAYLDEAVSQRIAECLGIAYVLLSDQQNIYQSAPTYHGKGAAIVSVLELIPINNTLEYRLLKAGFIAGLWGLPKRWDPG